MAICSSCGATVIDKAKFCHKCGRKIELAAESFCIECGTKNPAGYAFCIECGTRLVTETASDISPSLTESAEKTDGGTAYPATDEADDWGDTLSALAAREEEERLAAFEYERRPDGSVVITGLKDKYALTVTVPEGVTVIADGAFRETEILEVSLPEGLTHIGDEAFSCCVSLTKINIPSTVLKIGSFAFANCFELEVEIPSSVRILGQYAISCTKTEKLQQEAEEEAKRLEAERIEREKAEAEERARAEAEAAARAEAERLEAERLEAERVARERAEAEERAREEERKKWCDNLIPASADNLDKNDSPARYGYDSPEAFKWLLAKAEAGDIAAGIVVGKCYYFGCGVEKNNAESEEWFARIASKYNSQAARNLIDIMTNIWITDYAKNHTPWS